MEASSVKRSSNSPPNKCVEHNIGVDGVSESHSGIDHRTKSEKTNGRGERFHDRELPLPTWLVTRMQVLSTKSRKIESQLGWVERS